MTKHPISEIVTTISTSKLVLRGKTLLELLLLPQGIEGQNSKERPSKTRLEKHYANNKVYS